MTPNEKRPQQDCGGMFTQVQASVEILSPVPVSGKCSEKDYERLFIRDPEVKAREGKMAYVRPEYPFLLNLCLPWGKYSFLLFSTAKIRKLYHLARMERK